MQPAILKEIKKLFELTEKVIRTISRAVSKSPLYFLL